MPYRDHYVSQTYLKHFTNSDGNIVPYYKNERVVTGKPKRPKSICFETEGDTNKYFENSRLLDDFLPAFENRWNHNIAELENGDLPANAKYELSGYIAFLRIDKGVRSSFLHFLVTSRVSCASEEGPARGRRPIRNHRHSRRHKEA